MRAKCVVKNCNNSIARMGQKRKTGLTFHRFPKNSVIRQNWVNALQLWQEEITDNHRVCSEHDFNKSIPNVARLRRHAVPVSPPVFICEIKSEIDIDSPDSALEEENSPEVPNEFETIVIPMKNENTAERSSSPIFDALDENPLELSNNEETKTENKFDENTSERSSPFFDTLDENSLEPSNNLPIIKAANESKRDSKMKRFVDRATSVSPERLVNTPTEHIIRENCNKKVQSEQRDKRILRQHLRDAYLKISLLEAEMSELKQRVKGSRNWEST